MKKILKSDINLFEGAFIELTSIIDLENSSFTMPNNCTIFVKGGYFTNGTIKLAGARILPSYELLEHSGLVISGNPAVGTQKFDNGKPLWWNGSNWVDATGATV